jgi:hypothetical protein
MLILLLAAPRLAVGHETAMGIVEFREVRPGSYVGGWTLEPAMGAGRVMIRMPAHCVLVLPTLECGEKGLVGAISIPNLGADMSVVLLRVVPMTGEPRAYTITAARPMVSILGTSAVNFAAWLDLGLTYLNIGIDHILLGADHLLFVLGLIWIVPGGWRLVKTITAFTIGHSLSLAAAAFGLVGLSEKPLNACIALSIVFVGWEIERSRRGMRGLTVVAPWSVALGFGLVHGIGFASALAGLGIERRLLPAALLSFNIGVEIGQLAFVLLVLALLWAHRRLTATLPSWGDPLPAYVIGTVAMFWFIGRIARLLAA